MQPDPSIYLRAFRREAMSPALLGAGLESGASAVVAARMAEGLAQIALRIELMPQLVREVRPFYLALLRRVMRNLVETGGDVPRQIEEALAAAVGRVDEGEAEVRLHERLSDAIAAGLRRLHALEGCGDLPSLCIESCRLEYHRRQALDAALAAWKADADAPRADESEAEPCADALTRFLRQELPGSREIHVANIRRLAGFNSKDIFFLDIIGLEGWPRASVMRREPRFNATGASVAAEQGLLDNLARHGVPVPRVLAGRSANETEGGFILMERLPGAPRTSAALGDMAQLILGDVARLAAHFHAIRLPDDPRFGDAALSSRDRVRAQIEHFYDRWTRERTNDVLVIEAGRQWLLDNLERVSDRVGLVHGDFNLRNLLLDGDRIAGILDWELAHFGDVAEDLSYMRFDVEQVMEWDEFMAQYAEHGQFVPDAAAIDYFDVFASYWRAVIGGIVAAAYEAGRHRNFIHASCAFVEFRADCDRLAQYVASDGRRIV